MAFNMGFMAERDLAYCGLACALCRDPECLGCKKRGCPTEFECAVYRCAVEKGIDGCHACDEFPCEKGHVSVKTRAFNRYARENGKQALMDRLKANSEDGVIYHTPEETRGDYDRLETEEEVMRLIQFGRGEPRG